jgi:hypothetical protein
MKGEKKHTKTWDELVSEIFSEEDRKHMGDGIKNIMRDIFNASIKTPKKTRNQTHLKEIPIIPSIAKGDINYESFEKIYNQTILSLDTLKNWGAIKNYKTYNKTEYTDMGEDISPMPDEFLVALVNFYPQKMIDIVVKKSNSSIENFPIVELKSISLVTQKLALNCCHFIFIVLDGRYDKPVKFNVKNNKGEETAVAKLYRLSYCRMADFPENHLDYDWNIADSINNGLFKNPFVKDYIKSNGFKKPTLVKKSDDKKELVLNDKIGIERELVKDIKDQYRYLYSDKT